MVEGCVPPQARSMRLSTSAFAEVERSRLTVSSSTPIASAILVVDQRLSRSLATTSRLCSGRRPGPPGGLCGPAGPREQAEAPQVRDGPTGLSGGSSGGS